MVIIVSEETGAVSLAHKGRLLLDVNRQRLERHLRNFMSRPRDNLSDGRGVFGWLGGLRQDVTNIRTPDHSDEEDTL